MNRNPTTALLSSTTALMLILGIVVSMYFAIEAGNERDRAEDEKKFAQNETK